MKKTVVLILFIGFLIGLSFLLPVKVESACPTGYSSTPTIGGQTICCKAVGISGCILPDTLNAAGDECCHTDTGGSGPTGSWWLTNAWLTVNTYNVMVGQSVSGTLKIETRENIAHPYIDFDDGESIYFISDCDGSEFADDPETDPLICEYNFTHNYLSPGTYQIKGNYGGGSSFLAPTKTITVSEVPAQPPSGENWNPLTATTPEEIIEEFTNLIFYIISSLTVLFIMIGGFYILSAAGNPERINKGKKIILYTIIGFAIMATSRGIIALVYLVLGITV